MKNTFDVHPTYKLGLHFFPYYCIFLATKYLESRQGRAVGKLRTLMAASGNRACLKALQFILV
jgi:hypothetical protein